MPDLDALLLPLAVVLLAALTQGFLGFGYGIVAMAGLTLMRDLLHAAGVVNVTGLLLTATLLLRLRRQVLWSLVGRMAPGMVAGVALGVTALRVLERDVMVRALGATIVAIAAWNLFAPRLRERETRRLDVAVAFASGLLGGAFNTGGPPAVAHLYRRGEAPEALKATIQALFLTIGLSRLPLASAQGLMTPAIWWDALWLAPAVLAGSSLGVVAARWVAPERFRPLAWLALGLLGVVLFASA